MLVAGFLCPVTQAAVNFTSLFSFAGTNGTSPIAGLTRGSDGNLYGTTRMGGMFNLGTVFRVTTGGDHALLASFDGTNGAFPKSALTETTNGGSLFWGTASSGGTSNLGTIFKIESGGGLTTVSSFVGTNGANPQSGLVRSSAGRLFGTTFYGGTNSWPFGYGTVFEITTNGNLITRCSFDNDHGASPYATLVEGDNASLWGTTQVGGDSGAGTVFQLADSGSFALVASFHGTNGAYPLGRLARAADAVWYGTTYSGGLSNLGTVYRLASSNLTTLVSFNGLNGAEPYGGLLYGTDGLWYGMTAHGGSNGLGTVFQLSTNGVINNLHEFSGADGAEPYGELVRGDDGGLYGTTSIGGMHGKGTVFRITLSSLPPGSPEILSIQHQDGQTTLVWTTVPGRAYRLQFKNDLNDAWTNLGAATNAPAGTMAAADNTGLGQRFYRVVALP